MNQLLPQLRRESAEIADSLILDAEIDSLRSQLAAVTAQQALERELTLEIHQARGRVIMESPALRLVFGVDDEATVTDKSNVGMDDILSSAYLKKIESSALPEGFTDAVAKDLRVATHPDTGGDTQVSQKIAGILDNTKADPAFSIADALVATPRQMEKDSRTLRVERYRLHVALSGASPQFNSGEEARSNARPEIEGADWRIRTIAAFKSFQLIIGDNDTWNQFLQGLIQTRHAYLIDKVNRLQPTILSVQERLAKGDPVARDALAVKDIDAVFERIWSTIGNRKDSPLPYRPPYQNWLEILLPAMEMLDPGEKQGEEYTTFEPPIRITHAPAYNPGYGNYDQKLNHSYSNIY